MKKIMGKVTALLLSMVLSCTWLIQLSSTSAYAASKYITRYDAVKMIVQELNLKLDSDVKSESIQKSNGSQNDPYIKAALKAGIITEHTFSNFNKSVSKIDLAILLVRADEFLNGVTIEDSLVEEIIAKRISDISKVKKTLQPYMAKAFALGYIKGNSNGTYSTNRKMNPNSCVTEKYAKQLIALIHNTKERHLISPDGQLIRTTNLPEFVEYYPYILASYPNDYYDWEFEYMKYFTDNDIPMYGTKYMINLKHYASPKDFKQFNEGKPYFTSYMDHNRKKVTAAEIYDLCAEKWEDNARNYLKCAFNINYKSILKDKNWLETMMACDDQSIRDVEERKAYIQSYIDLAVKNKTIVQSEVIAVDKSSIYCGVDGIYIRAYVKYRVVSCDNFNRELQSPIVYTKYWYPNFTGLKVNVWRDCFLDLEVTMDHENCGIVKAVINDYYHDNRVVVK